MFGNIIAPMVIGFAADKIMGGSGVKGAIAGGTMGYGAGKPGAIPGVDPTSTIPSHLVSGGSELMSGSNALTTLGGQGIKNSYSGANFPNFSNTNLKPLDKLAEYSLPNLLSKGKDFVSDGFSDMTFADKLGVGMQAEGLLNRPTEQMQVPNIPIDRRSQTPTLTTPLISKIQGIQMPEEEELRQQYFNRPNFYG